MDPGTRTPGQMSWISKRIARLIHKAIGSNQLIPDGEKIAIGVSGGADSLCLLHILESMNRTGKRRWDLHAVHVDPGFEGWNSARVAKACKTIGVACAVVEADLPSNATRAGRDSCYACARERRKALFSFCSSNGIRKLALAHDMDDVNETFLMNLLYTSSARTILPAQPLFDGRLVIVRPLYHADKELIRRYLKSTGLRPVRNRCPFGRDSSRSTVRRFTERLYSHDPRIRTNLFAGLHNLKPEYLPAAKSYARPTAARLPQITT
jgi:tRNA 2-thiocytidine biosynthesis protein TtcA